MKLYNNNNKICLYKPRGQGNVELFKPVIDFDKERKCVRTLVWDCFREPAWKIYHHDDQRASSATKGQSAGCALFKTTETLLERPNKKNQKYY